MTDPITELALALDAGVRHAGFEPDEARCRREALAYLNRHPSYKAVRALALTDWDAAFARIVERCCPGETL